MTRKGLTAPVPPTATKRQHRSRAQRQAALRRRLLASLEELLADEPFPEITISRLVAHAGISRSTLYAYFPDKAALLLAVAGDVFDDALQAAEPWWSLDPEATIGDLESALSVIFDLYRRHRRVLTALVQAAAYEPTVAERFSGMLDGSRDRLTDHIARGQHAGHIRASLHPAETAGWLIWMLERGLHQLAAPTTDPDHAARQLRAATHIIWHTLYDHDAG